MNKHATTTRILITLMAAAMVCGAAGLAYALLYTGGTQDGYDSGVGATSDVVLISSGDQAFSSGDPVTVASAMTITAEHNYPGAGINATDDIRVTIPSGLEMVWDTSDTAAIIWGSAADKVSYTVSYEDAGKTLVINVTSDFADSDYITVIGVSFTSFASVGIGNLELEIDNAGTTAATDTGVKKIDLSLFSGGADDGYDSGLYYPGDSTDSIWFAPSGTTAFSAGSTMTTAGGTATSILAPADEGDYRMYVLDWVGNPSAESIAILTVDDTAPTASAPTNTAQTLKSGYTSTSTVQSNESGNIYLCKTGTACATQAEIDTAVTAHNAFLGKGAAFANTAYTVTVAAGLNEGVYDIVAVDAVLNVSSAVSGWLTVDNTAPTASAPTSAAQTLKSGDTSTSTVQSNEAGNIYLVKTGIGVATQAEMNGLVLAHNAFLGKGSAAANTPYTVTVAAWLNDGVYDIVAVDVAGNVSSAVSGWLTVDNTAPVISNVLITNTTMSMETYVKDTDTVTITADVDDAFLGSGDTAYITADLQDFDLGAAVNPNTYDGTTATWTLSNVTTTPDDGELTVTIGAQDPAGNDAVQGGDTITADNTAPAAPTGATIVSGDGWNTDWIADANKTAVKVSGSKSDDTVEIKIEIDTEEGFTGAPNTTLGSLGTGTTYEDTGGIDASGLADGDITVRVTAYDVVGNSAATTVTLASDTFNKDTVAPSGYSVDIVPSYVNLSNETNVSFAFTGAEVNTVYNYSIDDTDSGTQAMLGSGTTATATDTVGNIYAASLDDGTLTLTVTLTDAAGNTGAQAQDTVTKDAVAPGGYTVTIDQAYINSGNETAMSFTFTGAEVGAGYEYTVDDTNIGTTAVTGSGTVATATDTIGGSGGVINVSTLNDDVLTLTVTLTDAAGNESQAVTLSIGGTAGAKVLESASYEDSAKTLVLDVTSDFSVGEYVTISGAYFRDFTSGDFDNLELEVYNTGAAYSVDDKTIVIRTDLDGLDSQNRGGTADGWDYGESGEL